MRRSDCRANAGYSLQKSLDPRQKHSGMTTLRMIAPEGRLLWERLQPRALGYVTAKPPIPDKKHSGMTTLTIISPEGRFL